MKKTLLTLISAVLLSVSLTGCGGGDEASAPDEPKPTEVTTSVQKNKTDKANEKEDNDEKEESSETTSADEKESDQDEKDDE